MGIYEQGLAKTTANFVALTPSSFVERSAEVFGDLEAVVHGGRRYSWRETRDRAARLGRGRRAGARPPRRPPLQLARNPRPGRAAGERAARARRRPWHDGERNAPQHAG